MFFSLVNDVKGCLLIKSNCCLVQSNQIIFVKKKKINICHRDCPSRKGNKCSIFSSNQRRDNARSHMMHHHRISNNTPATRTATTTCQNNNHNTEVITKGQAKAASYHCIIAKEVQYRLPNWKKFIDRCPVVDLLPRLLTCVLCAFTGFV